jgi:hypothetical protein
MRQPQSFLQNQMNGMQLIQQQVSVSVQWVLSHFRATNAPLLQLTSQLSAWNNQRITKHAMAGQANDLSADDISAIKKTINTSIHQASVQLGDVFPDQLLFLAIGAIQIQAQTQSDQAWGRVNQLIVSTIESKKEKSVFQFSAIAITLLVFMSLFAMSNTQVKTTTPPATTFISVDSATHVDPLTIEMIELTYRKMKNGSCQLPQAAMLPEVQRVAYLNFINNGVIKVKQVESLRLALGYVNCLYPQDLMRL